MHILLVEDDINHAALITRCLEVAGRGNRVDHVADGQQALEYLTGNGEPTSRETKRSEDPPRRSLPDLVLLDLNLPRVSGHEVLAILKSSPATRTIPVVVLTTSDSDADRSTAYALHANSYLVKAAQFHVLRSMLDDVQRYWGNWNRGPNPSRRGEDPSGASR